MAVRCWSGGRAGLQAIKSAGPQGGCGRDDDSRQPMGNSRSAEGGEHSVGDTGLRHSLPHTILRG